MRTSAEKHFNDIFVNVSKICEQVDIDLSISCRTARQTQRCNVMADTPVDYYRISISIPFLENILTHIHEHLLKHNNI